ncbi:family 43 glycosylhydrolase [Anaerocolumna xylanovorans]|uniref:Glycosyl hydrolases family 43 n=1 Tax=Anaerocolumna xylanovorans DSM 12503 TaxID=1121345 RepID=A0A1M7Y165_9FIRM|nr:family 43 glycosylhydrolase [Anaerocolumna xylanovorans]SHO45427.1 Glycosyl hydrolases family 43 [Anaerocolumna xylanovorans DSM 12503]
MMQQQAYNPYLPSYEYIPDGEPYVFGDHLYIYGSHDKFNGGNYCELNYVCWSAPVDDLGNWKFEGGIFDKRKDPLCPNGDRNLFAPDVALGADGRYYLYYAFDFLGVMSVAVSDSPAGTYEFYGHVHYADGTLLGSREGDAFQFDPGVLVDSDGKVYLYSGFCPEHGPWEYFGMPAPIVRGGMVIELESDMLTVKKEPDYIFPWKANGKGTGFEGHEFFEASSIRKAGDKYYFIYSSINGHELCYATSNYPDKEFTYGGTIISNGDIYLDGRNEQEAVNYTGNNHGSMIEISGKWYVFYHRQTNRHQFSRQGCAEEIKIETDGTICQVEMTSCGLNGGPLWGKGKYNAGIACNLWSRKGAMRYEFGEKVPDFHPYFTQSGEDREDKPEQYIANMTEGSVAGFKYFSFEKTAVITITVRGKGKGVMWIGTKAGDKDVAAIEIMPSDEWYRYKGQLQVQDGKKALYFTYKGTAAIDFLEFEFDREE